MSTARRQARRLPLPAAWPVRSSPAAHPWAIISAGLAPILLTGAYLTAGLLQPASYSPVRTTISAMAGQAGTDRWVMTGGILLVGGCYLVTAAGLTGVRASARALLAVAGTAGIGIAASPEPARGATPRHLAWTVLGAVTIAVWPAFAARRAAPRPLILGACWSAAVTAVFVALLGWLLAETRDGSLLGLAERLTSSIQTCWPFIIAAALRRTRRPPPGPATGGSGEVKDGATARARARSRRQQATGSDPGLLVFDSQLTTYKILGELSGRGIRWLTLRQRGKTELARLDALPASAWKPAVIARSGRYRRPRLHEDMIKLPGISTQVRQIAIKNIGRDEPALLITSDLTTPGKNLFARYAERMMVENELDAYIGGFHLDALTSGVPLNVDLDTTLTVVAGNLYRLLALKLSRYERATPGTLWRDFLDATGTLHIEDTGVTCALNLRSHHPALIDAGFAELQAPIPWWDGRTLRFRFPPR